MTETVPPVAVGVTVMLLVVLLPVHPGGNVHVYEVAPGTATTEYVCATPLHTVAEPEIVPGCAGVAEEVTVSVC